MRKVLVSRPVTLPVESKVCQEKNLAKKQISLPKRTILNNWNIRNDSSNINAVLHPQEYLLTTRRKIEVAKKNYKNHTTASVQRKCCLSSNTCYCKEKGVKPKILARPRSCLTREDFEKRMPLIDLKRQPLKKCICTGDVENISELSGTELLKEYKERLIDDKSDVDLTEQRTDYEIYRAIENEKDLEELRKLQEKEEDQARSISTLRPTQYGFSEYGDYTDTELSDERAMDIAKMKNFRSLHYFETHGNEFLSQHLPQHDCVHQFQLDHRFLPVPVNPDVYGRSRCTICSKTMEEGEERSNSANYQFDEKTFQPSLRTFSKYYQTGLVPKTICFRKSGTKIELKVDEQDMKKLNCFIGKIKMPQYRNSFALRQQKMRYY